MNLKKLSKKQVAIINVGMSTQDGIPGPLFKNGTFGFIPIPDNDLSKRVPTYEKLGLGKWVSFPMRQVHNDPEFETMTFGDFELTKRGNPNIRVANALKLRPKDFLFFFASLSTKEHRKKRKTTGLFLVGYFEIEQILPYRKAKNSPIVRRNAHRLRSNDSGYTIWKGTKRSALLKYAVSMNRRNTNKYLRTSKGDKLPWGSIDRTGRERTNLEVINSATRASRLIDNKFREIFWRVVLDRNPDLPIFEN